MRNSSLTKIGEETGNLDVVMKGLAAYYEREENTMQDIKNAISYPLMILCMLLAIMLVMVVKVVPVFNQVYEQLGTQITGPGAVLLKAGEALKQYWIIPTVLLCVFMALQSGMDYGRSFDMAATLLENDEETKQKLMNCKEKMFEGESFSKVIRETEIYSPLQSRMIMIAERTGEADQALSKIAVQIDGEVTADIQNFVSVIEPTLVIVLSVLVGGMLLSVMMPLMGILSVIG